jgi:hypothetical protein
LWQHRAAFEPSTPTANHEEFNGPSCKPTQWPDQGSQAQCRSNRHLRFHNSKALVGRWLEDLLRLITMDLPHHSVNNKTMDLLLDNSRIVGHHLKILNFREQYPTPL